MARATVNSSRILQGDCSSYLQLSDLTRIDAQESVSENDIYKEVDVPETPAVRAGPH